MELKDFMLSELDRVSRNVAKTMNGLTRAEITWRPGPECNCIGLILIHNARSEDRFIQMRILGKPQVWDEGKWYEKLKLPADATGSHLTSEQLCAFPIPEYADIAAYSEAVRQRTVDFIKSGTPNKFDQMLHLGPPMGDATVGSLVGLVITHAAQHAGEIGYLRGVQRGIDK